jgi:hypothetical protein
MLASDGSLFECNKPKKFLFHFYLLLGIGFAIALLPPILLFFLKGPLAFDNGGLAIFLPGVFLLPLMAIFVYSILPLNEKVLYSDTILEIHWKKKKVQVGFSDILHMHHVFLKNALVIQTAKNEYVISKYLTGFENLLYLLQTQTGLSPIQLGKKTPIPINYFVAVGISGLGLNLFLGYLALISEDVDIVLVILSLLGSWVFSFLISFEAYRRYVFQEDHFVHHFIIGKKKVYYDVIDEVLLNKGQSMLHLKVGKKTIRVFPPMGIGLEDLYVFFLHKTKPGARD